MLRIKSAQFINSQPLPPGGSISGDSFSAGDQPNLCQGCEEPKSDEELQDGFCDNCIANGIVVPCMKCSHYFLEDDLEGGYCAECAEEMSPDPRWNTPLWQLKGRI